MKNSTKFKTALLLTSFAMAAGATAAAILLQKKREEEIYHEAELKAMDELEEMMRADGDDTACCDEGGEMPTNDASYQDAVEDHEILAEEEEATTDED